VIVADLRQNPEGLLETPPEVLLELLFARGEDLPEGTERPAIKELHLNRAPLLAPFRVLDEAGAARLQLDRAACQRHFDFIQAHREAFEALARWLYAAEPAPRPLDAEAALYQGFIPDADKQRVAHVRAMAPAKLAEIQPLLQDARLRELLFRYRARWFPASLTPAEQGRWHDLLSSRLLHDEGGAGLSAGRFFAAIEALRADPASTGREWLILDQLEDWGRQLLAEAGVTPG